jgi:phosphoribosylanthranilate isomerase
MRKNIKICGVTNCKTIKQLISLNVHYAGLVFHKTSPRNITKNKAKELVNLYARKINFVVVTQDMQLSDLIDLATDLNVRHLQLHGHESINYIKSLRRETTASIIKAIHVNDKNTSQAQQDIDKYKEFADYLLLDAKCDEKNFGGKGKVFDWSIINKLQLPAKWILSGGLNYDNISHAIKLTNADFLDVSSGVEITIGQKDNKKIIKFVNKINAQNS